MLEDVVKNKLKIPGADPIEIEDQAWEKRLKELATLKANKKKAETPPAKRGRARTSATQRNAIGR